MLPIMPSAPRLNMAWPAATTLLYTTAMSAPPWEDLRTKQKPTSTGNLARGDCPAGIGIKATGGNVYAAYSSSAQPPRVWAMHAVVFLTATTAGWVCGWNQSLLGTSATNDRSIYISSAGVLKAYLFDGAAKSISGPTLVANQLYDIWVFCNNSNFYMVVNGIIYAGTSISNGGFQGYTLPVYFVVGAAGTSSGGNVPDTPTTAAIVNGTLLSVECWQSASVQPNWADPFSLYRGRTNRVGSTSVAAAVPASGFFLIYGTF